MNFNKDYPIAILDTNIVMDVPNILDILKGCNIVIPYTLIEELDNHKKENKGARDFVNNFLALSEKANLSKDGYKLENDCMLYLDIDKNNLHHKDINLDSKKQDIKFIAEAKNLKEKYNDMEVVLISSDKIMKITASAFDVKVKFLEEFIFENKNIDGLYKLSEIYNSAKIYNKIYNILAENNDIVDILYKLSESYNPNEEFYKEISNILANDKNINGLYELAKYYEGAYYDISNILAENKDIDGLYKLSEIYNHIVFYNKIFNILVENKDIDGLYKLYEIYKSEKIYIIDYSNYNREDYKVKIYEAISNILAENKDIDGLYKLYEIYDSEEIYEKISNILAENKDIDGLYKLSESYNHIEIYNKIFNILVENKDIDGLYKLYEIYKSEKIYIIDYSNYNREDYKVKIYEAISNILAENKDIDGLYKLSESYNSDKKIYYKIFNILVENKDIDGLHKLKDTVYYFYRKAGEHHYYDLVSKIDYKIRKLENNK